MLSGVKSVLSSPLAHFVILGVIVFAVHAALRGAALERIRAGESPDVIGDPFMLQRNYLLRTQQEVSQLFGSEFGQSLFSIEPGGWDGPIRSSYGLHLVEIHRRTEPRRPELDEVSDRLRNDLLLFRGPTA
jgi:hypothetical protein